MALKVIKTTDGKYVGVSAPIDPRNPPEAIPVADGAVFNPTWWSEVSPGRWRIWNSNYTVFAEEV